MSAEEPERAVAEPPPDDGRDASPATAPADAAWARIETRLETSRLRVMLDEVERLFRINPLLEVTSLEEDGEQTSVARHPSATNASPDKAAHGLAHSSLGSASSTSAADRFRLTGRNLANGCDLDLLLHVARRPDGIDITYDQGLKTRTTLRIAAAAGGGSVLTITDEYGVASEEEKRARIGEVDGSLIPWAHALRVFFDRWHRWRWLAPWRWYMHRFWLPMRPSARRIVWLLWVVSALELAGFLVVLAVWRMG